MQQIPRINPRHLQAGFITAEGIKRIARDRNVESDSTATTDLRRKAPPRRKLNNPQGCIMALVLAKNGALEPLDSEVLYTARYLAEHYGNHSVIALVCGALETDLGRLGVDTIIPISYNLATEYDPQALAELICTLMDEHQPQHLVGGESDWGDADLLRRVAVSSAKTFAPQVVAINDDQLISYVDQHTEATSAYSDIICIHGGLSTGAMPFAWETQDLAVAQPQQTMEAPVTSLPPEHMALTEAPLVCAAGKGVGDMELFVQCAQALGASIGASRVVVDDGKLPREHQVGATGVDLAATVYLCFGISGAVQHLQGIRNCNTVIAVNTDPSCSMIQRADLSFIADAGAVMQAIIAIMQQETASTAAA